MAATEKVGTGSRDLEKAADEFALNPEKLKGLTAAYKKVTDALGEVDAAVRTKVSSEPHLTEVDELLAVAALSESLREWFPVDPEMTSVRGTVLVPKVMTESKPAAEKPVEATDKSFDVLFKELLAKLAK
ncbi:hypothetical protein ACLBXX_13005 [Microbacterium sp. C23T]